jgi:hypothetical protein
VSHNGTSVFVTGEAETGALSWEYATLDYSAITGRQLRAKLYSTSGNTAEEARQTAVSVARNIVYVTRGNGPGAGTAYATVAYGGATGAQLWSSSTVVLTGMPPATRWSSTMTGPGCT